MAKRAVSIAESTLGKDHPDTAAALNNLAQTRRMRGRYAEAEPLYRRALEIWKGAGMAGTREYAWAAGNLAGFFYERGRYSGAEELFRRAIGVLERASGPQSSDVAVMQCGLAEVYQAMQRNTQAEAIYREWIPLVQNKEKLDRAVAAYMRLKQKSTRTARSFQAAP